jgi:hypothetical protein
MQWLQLEHAWIYIVITLVLVHALVQDKKTGKLPTRFKR